MSEKQTNGWGEWEKYVLKELAEHCRTLNEIHRDITDLKVSLGKMEERMAIRSTIFGGIGSLIAIGIYVLTKLL